MTEPLNLIKLTNTPIYEQLQLEEALLRTDTRNFCIINEGSLPAIVMGISGKPEKLINLDKLRSQPIPVIKRYSGGGTVVVDQKTLFVSFIFNKTALPVEPFPQNIMKWSEEIYAPLFSDLKFSLRENDYVFSDKKFAGNAQYIQKERWVHHTTFLWDFDPENMDYLTIPEKAPLYRQNRSHLDFLCTLKSYFPEKEHFYEKLKAHLSKKFTLHQINEPSFFDLKDAPHRKSTSILSLKTYLN